MQLCKKPLRYHDRWCKLYPVEPYSCSVADWVGEQIDDAQEVAQETYESVKNLARETLKALTSQDGLSLGGVSKGDDSKVTYRVKVTLVTDIRPNNPRPVPGRPDSVIATTPLGGVKLPYVGGVEINKRHAIPIKKAGD